MDAGLADTSVFVARESGRELNRSLLPARLAVSAITIGELHAGVLAASNVMARSQRLETLQAASMLDPLPVDQAVASAWAQLRILLRDAGQRMPVNDSWIAATALAAGIPVVTQDGDYDTATGIGGLEVIHV